MGRVTRRHPVLRVNEHRVTRTDTLAVEEPLEVRIGGRPLQVTMRTPGDDVDLVHGLLHSEGLIAAGADVVVARYCAGTGPDGLNTYNVIDVALASGAGVPEERRRSTVTTSACGICGATSIEQVRRASRYPLPAGPVVAAEVVMTAPDRLRQQQRTFARTGGLHAAGLMSPDGAMVCVREDVGRHNAVDKVIGWALREDRLPLSEMVLCVSGRASFELTQKAVLAGIPMLVAVSAPSSLAVELAGEAGLTLVGFARGDSMNVYTGATRVSGAAH